MTRASGLHAPWEVRPLAWSRVALGILFLVRTTPLLVLLRLPFLMDASPLLGWPKGTWSGTGLLSLPAGLTAILCVVRTVAAVCFLLGYFARPAGIVAGTAGYLVMLGQPFGFVFTLHLLFQGTILLALTDADGTFALRPTPPIAPASGILLIRLFLASVYAWAGISKLRPDWLDGRTLALFAGDGAFHPWAASSILGTPSVRAFCATSVMLVELTLPWLLLLPRTRLLGLAAAFGLHTTIEIVARPDLLGWEMAALLLALWPPEWTRHQNDSTQGSAEAGQPMNP